MATRNYGFSKDISTGRRDPAIARMDLLRLLHVMEQQLSVSNTFNDSQDKRDYANEYTVLKKPINLERVENAQSLLRQLATELIDAELERRVETNCRRILEMETCSSSSVNGIITNHFHDGMSSDGIADNGDLIDRIFFSQNTRQSIKEYQQHTQPIGNITLAEVTQHVISHEEEEPNGSDANESIYLSQIGVSPSNEPEVSLKGLQDSQREQIEQAISIMAAQLKQQTASIHSTLQSQNADLNSMEELTESNVDKMDQLAKDVTNHVSKGWKRTLSTWMVFFSVAAAFVSTCLIILMVPKRRDACFFFCKPQSPSDRICHVINGRQECLHASEAIRLLQKKAKDIPLQDVNAKPHSIINNDDNGYENDIEICAAPIDQVHVDSDLSLVSSDNDILHVTITNAPMNILQKRESFAPKNPCRIMDTNTADSMDHSFQVKKVAKTSA